MINSFTEYFITKDKEKFSTLIKFIGMIKKTLFFNLKQTYDKIDLILGGHDEFLDYFSKGDFYDNFQPNKRKFTGFQINLKDEQIFKTKNLQVSSVTDKLFNFRNFKKSKKNLSKISQNINLYSIYTGRNSKNYNNLRIISKINDEKIFNFKKSIINEKGEVINYRIPLFKGKKLLDATDGFQYSIDKNYIYFYDKFSSNVLSFHFTSSSSYSNVYCDYYQMEEVKTPITNNDIANSSILKDSNGKLILIHS